MLRCRLIYEGKVHLTFQSLKFLDFVYAGRVSQMKLMRNLLHSRVGHESGVRITNDVVDYSPNSCALTAH